ncbi:MAG: DUF2809 domain-containing protein [Chloroflexi bacterium]|nr:DUF2809 domain-containing protein [Chloroflexota bacterium]
MKKSSAKVLLASAIALTLVWFAANFPYGAYLDGMAYRMYASYGNDVLLPFAFYFGLCALEVFIPALHSWKRKAIIAFLIPFTLELLQPLWRRGIGLDVMSADHLGLGTAFDPLDFLAYALGVFLAALTEQKLFARLSFWS